MPIDETVTSMRAPWRAKGGERRRHRHRRHVAQAELPGLDLDPEPAQERLDRLRGEGDRGVVAGAAEARDQAVPDELVAAGARHLGEVAQVLGAGACGGARRASARRAAVRAWSARKE